MTKKKAFLRIVCKDKSEGGFCGCQGSGNKQKLTITGTGILLDECFIAISCKSQETVIVFFRRIHFIPTVMFKLREKDKFCMASVTIDRFDHFKAFNGIHDRIT